MPALIQTLKMNENILLWVERFFSFQRGIINDARPPGGGGDGFLLSYWVGAHSAIVQEGIESLSRNS